MAADSVLQLEFKLLEAGAKLPVRQHEDDAGLDLFCLQPFAVAPGQRAMVRTGVAVAIPHGCVGLVTPRSGLAAKHGVSLVNAPGVIDSGYRGELQVLIQNTDQTDTFEATAGERIAQLLVVPVLLPEPVEVSELSQSSRGAGGFGSTGRS